MCRMKMIKYLSPKTLFLPSLGSLFTLFLVVQMVLAQPAYCAPLVNAAYSATEACLTAEDGTLCYGAGPLFVEDSEPLEIAGESQVLNDLNVINGVYDVEAEAWTLAQLRPITRSGPLHMLLMGETTLYNMGASAPVPTVALRVTERTGANVRTAPNPEAGLAGVLLSGQITPAIGRTPTNDWFQVMTETGLIGWVWSELVRVEDGQDLESIPVATQGTVTPPTLRNPFEAFRLISAGQDSPCADQPNSGLLLQSPEPNRPIEVIANDVLIQFAGTLYLQAPADADFTISVLEGYANITAGNITQNPIDGQRVRVQWDAESESLTTPRPPQPYRYIDMVGLPFGLLPRGKIELDVSLEGIVTPAAPHGGILEGILAEHTCTVAVRGEVRVRYGPGTEYPVQGTLQPGESVNPDARAVSLDGVIWWRIRPTLWVSADIVAAAGDCSARLPLVEELPPIPQG